MSNAFLLRSLDFASVVANSTAPGTGAANVASDYAGVVWRSGSGGSANIVIDLGGNAGFDTIMLFGADRSNLAATNVGVAIATEVQGPTFSGSNVDTGTGTGNYWRRTIALLAGANMPVNGKGVMLWLSPTVSGPPGGGGRYIQLTFSGYGSGGFIQVARALIGTRIQPTRNFSYGAARGVQDLGSLEYSARGALLRRRAKKLRTVTLTFSSLYKDEVEQQTARLMEGIGITEMIALVTDPDPHAERQSRCFFGPLVGDLSHTWRNAAAWEAKVSLVSAF